MPSLAGFGGAEIEGINGDVEVLGHCKDELHSILAFQLAFAYFGYAISPETPRRVALVLDLTQSGVEDLCGKPVDNEILFF